MKVRIVLLGSESVKTYIIKDESSTFLSNKCKKTIDTKKFFNDFQKIIKDWPFTLENHTIQGGLSCVIMFAKDNEELVYTFAGSFPENFQNLLTFIEGVENGNSN